METHDFIIILIGNSHLIGSILVLIIMLIKFPESAKKKDPNWWYNNIWNMLTTSFAIGGFIAMGIGFSFLAINGVWPSDYIPVNTITTSIFMIVIYLIAEAYHHWKSYVNNIEEKYEIPKVTDKRKNKNQLDSQEEE